MKNQPGIESKRVACPVCKNISYFKEFKKIDEPKEESGREAEEMQGDYGIFHRKANGTPVTTLDYSLNFRLGRLYVPSLDLIYQLKPGTNIIGRLASASSADFQIPCATRHMSREHVVIEIQNVENKGFVHYISLYKEKVNPTFIGDNRLEYGDCVVLKDGDLITLADMEIEFYMPDVESQEI